MKADGQQIEHKNRAAACSCAFLDPLPMFDVEGSQCRRDLQGAHQSSNFSNHVITKGVFSHLVRYVTVYQWL